MLQTRTSRREITDLLNAASVELPPRADPATLVGRFAPHSDIYIAYLPGDQTQRIIEAARAIRSYGYNPVPHIAAHEIGGVKALDDLVAALCGEADVRRVLVVAGDGSVVRGPFPTSTSILASGALQRHGVQQVQVAGHPEGNAHFTRDASIDILAAKVALAQREGLEIGVTSQFCFASAPILEWLGALHKRRLDVPVRIGLAGPATLPTLLKFALRCGIGNSLKALRPNIGRFGRLLSDAGPDEVVDGLGQALETVDDTTLQGFHFFAFGGLRKTSTWVETRLQRH